MKTLNLARLLGLLMLIVTFSCRESKKISPAPISWYSDDPVSIPFRIRLQKFERENLVNNNSFESGKTFIVDTTETTFRIDGWQKVGNNVEWVNIEQDSIYNPCEAIDSIHAIKIHRKKADETDDEGEGVISDFIKVIPGNYSLSYYVKLENVCSNTWRLGTKLFDAVNIRIYYFDRNKIPVSSELYLPHKEISIDNSFKGLSFSNYWQIDKFSWEKVNGKSHNYIFPDGNIPDDARYVKLFFGFKGTGTVWFDNIDFHFTKSNFTAHERMEILTDTLYSKHEVIIPAPKKIEKYESIIYYRKDADINNLPLILIPDKSDVETHNAARLLKSKFENLFSLLLDNTDKKPDIKIITRLSPAQIKSSKLILSVGKNKLYTRFKEILPVSKIKHIPQSYFIYTNSDIPNIIFMAGKNPVGDYYAATTAIQLFDNKKFIFHNAKVVDYPDFYNRYYHLPAQDNTEGITEDIAYSDELSKYKLNGAYISTELSDENSGYINTVKSFAEKYSGSETFNFKMLVAPREFFRYIAGDKQPFIPGRKTYMNDFKYGTLKNICETGFRRGASGIAYVHYFINPAWLKYCQAGLIDNFNIDTRKYYWYINNLNVHLKNSYPGKKLEILLPFYNNEFIDKEKGNVLLFQDNLESWSMNDISYFWSGNSWHSLNNDNADLDRITGCLNNVPLFWDNSIISVSSAGDYSGCYPYYPGKIRLCNLFEPYNNDNIKVILSKINKNQIFFNGTVNTELDLIKFATVADFSWNSKTYDPDISLWKVLLSRYGYDTAKELMILSDQYFSLVEVILKIKAGDQSQKLVRTGENIINDLNLSMEELYSLLTKTHPLMKELYNKTGSSIKEFSELTSIIKVEQNNSTDNEGVK